MKNKEIKFFSCIGDDPVSKAIQAEIIEER